MKKNILITGCSSGFGLLTAIKFYEEGWNVIGTVRRITEQIRARIPKEIELVELDITDKIRIQQVIKKIVIRHERIEVLVNNAGVGSIGLFEQHCEEVTRYLFEVNVFGTMNMIKVVLPYMREQNEGKIINVSSIRGIVGGSLKSVYAATKFALQGFSESLQQELFEWNIEVKTILPSAYDTNFKHNSFNHIKLGDSDLQMEAQRLFDTLQRKKENQLKLIRTKPDPHEVSDKIFEITTHKSPLHSFIG